MRLFKTAKIIKVANLNTRQIKENVGITVITYECLKLNNSNQVMSPQKNKEENHNKSEYLKEPL